MIAGEASSTNCFALPVTVPFRRVDASAPEAFPLKWKPYSW
jgi:hypothetical protein